MPDKQVSFRGIQLEMDNAKHENTKRNLTSLTAAKDHVDSQNLRHVKIKQHNKTTDSSSQIFKNKLEITVKIEFAVNSSEYIR